MKFKIRDGSPQETPTEFWLEGEDGRIKLMASNPSVESGVNFVIYCLHLWRPIGVDIPLPPSELIGPKQIRRSV